MWAFFHRSDDPFAKCRSTQIIGGAGSIGGPFTLINQDGITVSERDVIKSLRWCISDIRSALMSAPWTVRAMQRRWISARGMSATPVFISVDPKRDTPEVVEEFTKWLHPKMIGLTGTPEQVKGKPSLSDILQSP